MPFNSFKSSPILTEKESIRLNLRKKTASGRMNVLHFVDKDTKQHVFFIPALDISGYGETIKKANEMLKFAMVDFFKHISSLPVSKIQNELSNLGWKRTIFHKEFSRAYIDGNGELNNFNAEDNKVERLTLEAA